MLALCLDFSVRDGLRLLLLGVTLLGCVCGVVGVGWLDVCAVGDGGGADVEGEGAESVESVD